MDQAIAQKIEELLDAPSIYPEVERKPREQRRRDLEEWYERYDEVNLWYNLYGLDRVDAPDQNLYLDNGKLRKQRFDANSKFYPVGSEFPYDYTLVMRDKLTFENFLSRAASKKSEYVPSIAVIRNGVLRPRKDDGLLADVQTLREFLAPYVGQSLVFKQTYGAHGNTVEVVDITEDGVVSDDKSYTFEEYAAYLTDPRICWLVQEFIKQHPEVSKLNPTSVNCMRMVTYSTGTRVFVDDDHAVIRIGIPGARTNEIQGGALPILVNKDGILAPEAYSVIPVGRFTHEFGGLQIPFYQEAKELVVRLHEQIPELFTVGWDVAITEEGPLIIEGNDGWAPRLLQCAWGNGLRPMWDELLAERMENMSPTA
jgi:hypothetical protein